MAQRHPETETRNRLAAIDRELGDIDRRLAQDFPKYSALARPEPATVADVRRHLKDNEALVLLLPTPALAPTTGETFIWVVTKTRGRWVRSHIRPRELKDLVDALRCGLDYTGSWRGERCFDLLKTVYTETDYQSVTPLPFRLTLAHTLYKALFGGIEDLIEGKDLLIVPSGSLTQLPFQVLVTKPPTTDEPTRESFGQASWLIRDHALTVLPSVVALPALRDHAPSIQASKPFIGFGNPLLEGDPRVASDRRAARRACAAACTDGRPG